VEEDDIVAEPLPCQRARVVKQTEGRFLLRVLEQEIYNWERHDSAEGVDPLELDCWRNEVDEIEHIEVTILHRRELEGGILRFRREPQVHPRRPLLRVKSINLVQPLS